MTTSFSTDPPTTEASGSGALAAQQRGLLPGLLSKVQEARSREGELGRGLRRWSDQSALAQARTETLDALLAYSAAIEALSWPVPRSLVLEIQMHRNLCSARRPNPQD